MEVRMLIDYMNLVPGPPWLNHVDKTWNNSCIFLCFDSGMTSNYFHCSEAILVKLFICAISNIVIVMHRGAVPFLFVYFVLMLETASNSLW